MSKNKTLLDKLDFTGLLPALSSVAVLFNEYFRLKSYGADTSLIDATKITTVEPLTIVSKDLISVDYIDDVTSTTLNLFAAYYLQAIDILTKVKDVEVIKLLDKLNPNRDSSGFLAMESMHPSVDLDNYKYQLPTTTTVAAEADLDKGDKEELRAASNMAVGKMLDVTVQVDGVDDENKPRKIDVKIPITIRLLTSLVANSTIKQLLIGKSIDKSFVERYHNWRAGKISFIKDLVLCQDLITEHKKAAIEDDSDIAVKILNRVTAAKSYGVITSNPSLSVASNIFIISEAIAKEMEMEIKGKLSKKSVRDKIFEDSYIMILVVVDREWERVTFYTRGTDVGNEMSIKEVKKSSKGKGPDISDILKSFQLGMGASF